MSCTPRSHPSISKVPSKHRREYHGYLLNKDSMNILQFKGQGIQVLGKLMLSAYQTPRTRERCKQSQYEAYQEQADIKKEGQKHLQGQEAMM